MWNFGGRFVACGVVGLMMIASPGSMAGASAVAVEQAVPAPTITVTPSTDLLDGQSVTVVGSGFSADVTMIDLIETRTPNVVQFPNVPASGGSFSITIAVHRFVNAVDCAATGGGLCYIAAANMDGGTEPYSEIAVAPVTFQNLPTAPRAPGIIRNATAGNAEATISWNAPNSDGGSPITGYVVTPYVGYYPFPPVTFDSTDTTQTIAGRVINGLTYRFRVQAINAIGTGGYSRVSNVVTASTLVAPGLGAPTALLDATGGPGWSATVSWTPPTSDGGSVVTGYVVTPYVGLFAFPSYTFHSTATTAMLTQLYPGFTYRFRVQATNANGTGASSTVTNPVTPSA